MSTSDRGFGFDVNAVRATIAHAEALRRQRELRDPIPVPESEKRDPNAHVKRVLAQSEGFQRQHGVAPNIIVKRHHDHLSHLLAPTVRMTHWPTCLRCGDIVEGYKIGHDSSTEVEIVAECHGQKDSRVIKKHFRDVLESEETWLQEVCRMLTFFSPSGAG